jgi:hypothetical protein
MRHDWKSCPSLCLSLHGYRKSKNDAEVKSSGQECPLHNISVILSGAKDPAAARAGEEDARHSPDAAGVS